MKKLSRVKIVGYSSLVVFLSLFIISIFIPLFTLILVLSIIFTLVIIAIKAGKYISNDIIREIEMINTEGKKGRVLVAFRPGISRFQEHVMRAFTEGLKSADWRIDFTTISSKTPLDLSSYDILVLGAPNYGGIPHKSINAYFDKISDFNEKNLVLVTTAMAGNEALEVMQEMAEKRNGKVLEAENFLVKDKTATQKCQKIAKNLKLPPE